MLKSRWRGVARLVLFAAVLVLLRAFVSGPLIDGLFAAMPAWMTPILFRSEGPTPTGYGVMGLFAVLATLAAVMIPYWLISKMLGLPIRDDAR
jgi:hypothetical protein